VGRGGMRTFCASKAYVDAGATPRQALRSAKVSSTADFSQLPGAVEKSRGTEYPPTKKSKSKDLLFCFFTPRLTVSDN